MSDLLDRCPQDQVRYLVERFSTNLKIKTALEAVLTGLDRAGEFGGLSEFLSKSLGTMLTTKFQGFQEDCSAALLLKIYLDSDFGGGIEMFVPRGVMKRSRVSANVVQDAVLACLKATVYGPTGRGGSQVKWTDERLLLVLQTYEALVIAVKNARHFVKSATSPAARRRGRDISVEEACEMAAQRYFIPDDVKEATFDLPTSPSDIALDWLVERLRREVKDLRRLGRDGLSKQLTNARKLRLLLDGKVSS